MAYFNTKERRIEPRPIPPTPPYVPPAPPTPPTPSAGSTPDIPRTTFSGSTNVTLYITLDDKMKLEKTLSNAVEFEISFNEDTSVINPVMYIETNMDLSLYNYCYIEATQRYYYIQNTVLCTGNRYRIYALCDVLMSFKDYIKNIKGIVIETETENISSKELPNPHFVNSSGKQIEIIPFKGIDKDGHQVNPFSTTPHNILVVAGKSQ